jgi:hypothetical protein
MLPCRCKFKLSSWELGNTKNPQQSPSRCPNKDVGTGSKFCLWIHKRNCSVNWSTPWLKSGPKMSQHVSLRVGGKHKKSNFNLFFEMIFLWFFMILIYELEKMLFWFYENFMIILWCFLWLILWFFKVFFRPRRPKKNIKKS